MRPSRPTYTGSAGRSAATMCPRHRSSPNRRSVRSRAVSRCTSRSRSSASWPVPPGSRRAASTRSRQVGDRLLEALARWRRSAPRRRRPGPGSAFAARSSGRSNALVVRGSTDQLPPVGEWPRPPIVGPHRGLAASPPVRYTLEKERSTTPLRCCVRARGRALRHDSGTGGTVGP